MASDCTTLRPILTNFLVRPQNSSEKRIPGYFLLHALVCLSMSPLNFTGITTTRLIAQNPVFLIGINSYMRDTVDQWVSGEEPGIRKHRFNFGKEDDQIPSCPSPQYITFRLTSRVSSWRRSRSLAFADLRRSSSLCFCSTSLSCLSIQNCSSSCRFCNIEETSPNWADSAA